MQFYVIPPTNHLNLVELGDHIFVLAHLYLNDETYRNGIDKLRLSMPNARVTLDNGAAERQLVSTPDLITAVKMLRPSEVISPDVLFDGKQTAHLLDSFTDDLIREGLQNLVKVMFVPQGKTDKEWLVNYIYGLNHDAVHTIGFSKISIPKCFNNVVDDQLIMESRHKCWDYLEKHRQISKPIHFLGMGDPNEFNHYNHPMARSTDSCNSVWSAMNNILWDQNNFTRIPTPHNYFDQLLNNRTIGNAISNIEWFRNSLSRHSVSIS